jgi:hypothetical protein
MNKITALLAALSLTSVAGAQDEIVEDTVSVRRYAVELIVFTYAEDVSLGTEVFPPDEPPVIEESLLPVDPDGIIVFLILSTSMIFNTRVIRSSRRSARYTRELAP